MFQSYTFFFRLRSRLNVGAEICFRRVMLHRHVQIFLYRWISSEGHRRLSERRATWGSSEVRSPQTSGHHKIGGGFREENFRQEGFTVKVNAVQSSAQGGKPRPAKITDDPVGRKEINKLMKGKYFRCGEGHQMDQCSQRGNTLKCTSCNR